MARVGGFLHRAEAARSASEEPVLRRYWHRLPWLLAGLAGSLVASGIVGLFEADLLRHVVLAFFLPSIVYMADAVGTQTETLVVRGLSLGVPIRRVLVGELLTGLLVGLTLAVVSFPLVVWLWGIPAVALTLSLALVAASSTATLVGMGLPWMLAKLGWDPAFGSGPIATVVQDILSLGIYLAIAVALLA